MTKNEILAELLKASEMIANHKRGNGSLTALKAYQRKMYAKYTKAA
jgi:hypothetical protein